VNDEDLARRRIMIQNLYAAEIIEWKDAILNSGETNEEHKERIRTRAHILKADRERDRKEFVKQAYDKQWRDACDDARTLDSAALMTKLMEDRRDRVNYGENEGKKKAAEDAAKHAADWKLQMAALDEKERAEQKIRYDRNVSNRETLDEQCHVLNGKKYDLRVKNRTEELDELEQWRREDAAEKDKTDRLKSEAHARGAANRDFNMANSGKSAIEKARVREHDLLLLQYALEKEGVEVAGEKAKKEAEIDMARKYRKFLDEQMIREAEDTGVLDGIRAAEAEKIWIKRDNNLKAQTDARDHLMNEVDKGRKEQIRIHQERAADDRTYFAEQIQLDKLEWDRQEDLEQERKRVLKDGVRHNTSVLKEQMALKQLVEAREEQEKYLENKQMDHIEKKHQARLLAEAGVVKTSHPRSHTNWYS
jgi:hypothetical protein